MTAARRRAYVGLGSNLDGPVLRVRKAIEALARLPRSALVATSRLYRSEPLGPPGQPDYVNAAVALDTALDPVALLDRLQAIEVQHGRERGLHWGPRTLDLDLLLYGDLQMHTARLTLPHPHLHERAFVLQPLLDIDPDLAVPGLGHADVLLAGLPKDLVADLRTAGVDDFIHVRSDAHAALSLARKRRR